MEAWAVRLAQFFRWRKNSIFDYYPVAFKEDKGMRQAPILPLLGVSGSDSLHESQEPDASLGAHLGKPVFNCLNIGNQRAWKVTVCSAPGSPNLLPLRLAVTKRDNIFLCNGLELSQG